MMFLYQRMWYCLNLFVKGVYEGREAGLLDLFVNLLVQVLMACPLIEI